MTRSAARQAEIDRLFDCFLDLCEEDREERLGRVAAGDPELAAAVRGLLAAAAETDPRLTPGAPLAGLDLEELLGAGSDADRVGERVGPYRITGELGRGGMSVVYLAERADGLFEQRVALKFLAPSLLGEEPLRRFERERRILAGLEHPSIARLLDGGADDQGRPYIVMEHVEGIAIDRFCERDRCPLERRLDLFVAVARAVDFAHRHLVVHRDLKPSNILVTAAGEPKLLDFGIAKLIEEEPGEDFAAAPTRTLLRALTPEYASPELLRGERVTTASDVYQLGLLLYELLASVPAFDLAGARATEVERTICEVQPRAPSEAVAAVGSRLPGLETGALARRLGGDLDNIVLAALHKEPERRYPSVARLLEDLERHSRGLPVSARPPTLGYRASRFVRRHRLGLAAASLVVWALIGGVAVASWQAVTASQERARAERALAEAELARGEAEEIGRFLMEVFELSDPDRGRGESVTARELLDRGGRRIAEEVREPRLAASLLNVMGGAYRSLGLYEESEDLLVEAVARARADDGSGLAPDLLAESLVGLGRLRMDQRSLEEAEQHLEEALEIRRRRPGSGSAELVSSLRGLAELRHLQGDLDAAEELLAEALTLVRRHLGEGHRSVAALLTELGRVHLFRGEYATAEGFLSEAAARQRELVPIPGRELATSLNHLGQVRHNQARLEEAGAHYSEAHSLLHELLGPDHPQTADTLNNLGTLLYAQGDHSGAEAVFREVFGARLRTVGEDHPLTGHTLGNLGSALMEQGRYQEAEEALARGLEVRRRVYGGEHREVAFALLGVGGLYRRQGRHEEAEAAFGEALRIYRRVLPPDHPLVARTLVGYGVVLLEAGRPEAALPVFREGLETSRSVLGEEHSVTRAAENRLAETLERLESPGGS